MSESPIISVIVPVYNAEKYLKQCIDSILSQDFADFELLLIDDGSKDTSGSICDEYAQKDKRIRVFHKENRGVSSARNVGLDNAKGEWIYFSDADDEVDKNGLKRLLELTSNQIDLVMAGYKVLGKNQIIQYCTQLKSCSEYISPNQALTELYYPIHGYYQGFLWSKLFRSSVIRENSHKFNTNIYYNEDRLFIFEYICLSKKNVCYSDISVYNYYQREYSAMSKLKTKYDKKFITDFDAFYLMKKCLLESQYANKNLIILSNRGMFSSYMNNKCMMKSSNTPPIKELNTIRKILIREIGVISYISFYLRRLLRKIFYIIKDNVFKLHQNEKI